MTSAPGFMHSNRRMNQAKDQNSKIKKVASSQHKVQTIDGANGSPFLDKLTLQAF